MPMATKEAQREYQRIWMAKRRQDFMGDKACELCGSTRYLQLHHVDSTTKIDHKVWSWAAHRRKAEIEKCIVVCAKCHNRFHHPPTAEHGTLKRYKNSYKCRCLECKAANAKYEQARRQQQRVSLE